MVEPRAKRRRTLVCNCTLCNGQERDHRTVRHHQSILLADASQSVHDDSTNLSNSFGEGSCTNETTLPTSRSSEDPGTQTISESLPNSQIFTNRIQEYILKEVKVKLDHGQSQHVAEEHLKIAADLLGDNQIPRTWADTIKFLHKMGYKDPKHYKVCLGTDHSQLLWDKKSHPNCSKCHKPRSSC